MRIFKFPPVELADPSGLLAIGGGLNVETLKLAYESGIFPWPCSEEDPILWFAPPKRAILEFDNLHIPRRLEKELKKSDFQLRIDTCFEQVIKACAQSPHRKGQTGTWITPQMTEAYLVFHYAGYAHSFETFNREGKLVGGLYGVWIENFFAGESMFYRESNASKFALLQTVMHLQSQGITWMDIQMLTPLLKSFGAREIGRDEFMRKLQASLSPSS